jgi:hypothetical protein
MVRWYAGARFAPRLVGERKGKGSMGVTGPIRPVSPLLPSEGNGRGGSYLPALASLKRLATALQLTTFHQASM